VLLGYDVVQYHLIPSYRDGGVAVRGIPEHAYNFNGYQFWFSTEENRNLFMADPWKYAPAWGGFCSWGIARELPPQWPWQVRAFVWSLPDKSTAESFVDSIFQCYVLVKRLTTWVLPPLLGRGGSSSTAC